ncbi:MAG: TonB-dependent receptor [Burkholderiales bacterium]|nr:TonB-dependent receptor [Burkholderiales bacterium]
MVIDGVVMGLGPVLESMVDVERLEVLKGPQGTQFGKNASSGVVSISTRRPALRKFGGEATLSYGALNEHEASVTLNVPLSETMAARVSVFDHAHDGFVDNVVRQETWGGLKASGGRAKLLFAPAVNLDVLIGADATRTRREGPSQLWTVRQAAPSQTAVYTALRIAPGADNTQAAEDASGYTRVNASGVSAEVNYRTGGFTLTSVTAHRIRDGSQRYGLDALPATIVEGGGNFTSTQDSQELRVTSPRGVVEYVAGAYWSQLKSVTSDSNWLQPALLGAPVPPGVFVSVSEGVNRTTTISDSAALFGDGKLRLSESTSLLAGLRVTSDKVKASNIGDASVPAGPEVGNPPGFLVPPVGRAFQVGETSATKASGRIGGEWKAGKELMFYGTVAKGYLGPTITFSSQQGLRSEVKAQSVDDLTLGVKSEWLNRKLTLNGSLFHNHYKNLQVGVFRAATSEFITENAGAMTSKGFEVDASARMGGGLSARVSLTYARAQFDDYITQCPTSGNGARCFTPAGTLTSLYQAAGDDVPGAPKLTSTFGLDYNTAVGSGVQMDASLSLSHRSKTSYGVGEPDSVQDGYTLVNAAVKFGPDSSAWSIGLWARNLFDKHYQAAVIVQPFSPPGGVVNWNTRDARRAMGLSITVRF